MKRERPFTDFPHLIDLQQANNADMGSILHSRVTAAAICEHVGNEMRKNLIKAVIDSDEKIGIMIDEATTNSSKNIGCVFAIFFKRQALITVPGFDRIAKSRQSDHLRLFA